jgi:hypothetical protein
MMPQVKWARGKTKVDCGGDVYNTPCAGPSTQIETIFLGPPLEGFNGTLRPETVNSADCPASRLLCIAGDFTKCDEHTVKQINRNIVLLRYRRFGFAADRPQERAAKSEGPISGSERLPCRLW